MIPTPDISHLTAKDYDSIYEPAEDTFLLLDALEAEEQALKDSKPSICLEVGSGSGCVSTFLTKIVHPAVYICTDINPRACVATRSTGRQNKIELDVCNASFALPFRQRLKNSIDVIVFNPPYVPTSFEEAQFAQDNQHLEGAWAGGLDGMHVTNTFLSDVKDLLSDKGRFYLAALKQNNVSEIQTRMLEEHGLRSKVVLERRAGREYLYILCFQHSKAL
ncbi:methylase [Coprinopsis marcescibilis]|uniref:Methylase n=1 Tax=Coprinopsis marcescibilis TaxID=230819 RepID=A0A5C3LC03_COPMA|nr:methylase [Coprinopsis marcescibilis]